jgi:hypothetical protein
MHFIFKPADTLSSLGKLLVARILPAVMSQHKRIWQLKESSSGEKTPKGFGC